MHRTTVAIAALALATVVAAGARQAPDVEQLRASDPPPDGVWVDSLDMSAVAATVIRQPRGRGGQPAPATPPVHVLGGVTYPHAIPMQSDRDLSIDLKGRAVRFASMVGIDSSVPAGRGSVIFGVWVDGTKAADSGVLRGGDPPKLVSVDLKGARTLTLAVIPHLLHLAAGAIFLPLILAQDIFIALLYVSWYIAKAGLATTAPVAFAFLLADFALTYGLDALIR